MGYILKNMEARYQHTEKMAHNTMVIRKYGYEYTLVEGTDRGGAHPAPCAFGKQGWALKSCKKIE